jgi:hypothetical protein
VAHVFENCELNLISWRQLEEISDVHYVQREYVLCDLGGGVKFVFMSNGMGLDMAVH